MAALKDGLLVLRRLEVRRQRALDCTSHCEGRGRGWDSDGFEESDSERDSLGDDVGRRFVEVKYGQEAVGGMR